MNLLCFGLNHRTAPIEARERFVGHARTEALLRDLIGVPGEVVRSEASPEGTSARDLASQRPAQPLPA